MIKPFEGKTPVVPATAWVAETALVVGDVVLGEHVNIWPGAVLRGDTAPISVGDYTNIQDNCVVHGDSGTTVSIGSSVTIGHSVTVHCASIGDNCLIGIAATLLGKATVGASCMIAAGALVREGTTIPDGEFWAGLPAVRKGEVKPDMIDPVAGRARHYMALAERHRRAGT